MRARGALAVVLAAAGLAACGGGSGDTASTATAPTVAPAPRAATPAPPGTPPVPRRTWFSALERYCRGTVAAVEQLAGTRVDERDPVAPIATFARRYRAGVERLGAVTPPPALRRFHLLTLAQGRESAERIDDGVRLGRAGDTDAATTALGELSGVLPATLPRAVRRGAPDCVEAISQR